MKAFRKNFLGTTVLLSLVLWSSPAEAMFRKIACHPDMFDDVRTGISQAAGRFGAEAVAQKLCKVFSDILGVAELNKEIAGLKTSSSQLQTSLDTLVGEKRAADEALKAATAKAVQAEKDAQALTTRALQAEAATAKTMVESNTAQTASKSLSQQLEQRQAQLQLLEKEKQESQKLVQSRDIEIAMITKQLERERIEKQILETAQKQSAAVLAESRQQTQALRLKHQETQSRFQALETAITENDALKQELGLQKVKLLEHRDLQEQALILQEKAQVFVDEFQKAKTQFIQTQQQTQKGMGSLIEMMRAFALAESIEEFTQAQSLAQKFLEPHPQ